MNDMQESEPDVYPDSSYWIFVEGMTSIRSIFESIHEALGDCCLVEDSLRYIDSSNRGFNTCSLVRRRQ